MKADGKRSVIDRFCSVAGNVPQLKPGEVHIWSADLQMQSEQISFFSRVLSPDELKRSEHYYFDRDRNHFIASRGILRNLLGRYLDSSPGEIRFCYSPYGKPAVEAGQNENGLCFNVSHSRGAALYAFSVCCEIGIDIEYIRPDQFQETMASGIFSEGEIAALSGLPGHLRDKESFACWTYKEAYLKARGTGLSCSPGRVEVSLGLPGTPSILSIDGDYNEAPLWSLRKLDAGPRYAAALAVKPHEQEIRYYKWDRLFKM